MNADRTGPSPRKRFLRELAPRAVAGTLTVDDSAALQKQFDDDLREEMEDAKLANITDPQIKAAVRSLLVSMVSKRLARDVRITDLTQRLEALEQPHAKEQVRRLEELLSLSDAPTGIAL